MKYTIENKTDNIQEDKITKVWEHTAEFSMKDIDNDIERLEKINKELESQANVNKAKIANIETHNDFVLKLSDKELFACHMYQEAKAIVLATEKKKQEVVEAIDGLKAEILIIKEQIPELN